MGFAQKALLNQWLESTLTSNSPNIGLMLKKLSAKFFMMNSAVLVVSVLWVSCASKQVTKISPAEVPKELPKEIQDKFQVKEITEAPTPPVEEASPSPSGSPSISPSPGPSASPSPSPPVVVVKPKKSEKLEKGEPQGFQWLSRRPKFDPIWIGEKLNYEVTYFGMAAGDFTLEVQPHKMVNSRKVYHVKGVARSSKVFSFFYKLEDTVESFFDFEGLFSHRFQLELDESKQTRAAVELNDSEKGMTFYWNRWNHYVKGYSEIKDYNPMPPFSQDSLSALYYIRTLPLANGSVVTIPIASEGKVWEAQVTVLRRETISTPVGKLKTIVLKPEHKFQGIAQKSGDSFIWITDDDRKFMVKIEARVRIGTVLATLKSIERGRAP